MKKRRPENQNISFKVGRVLNIILIFLLLIIIRVWHLAVMQHEEKLAASQKPQRRCQVEKADRATISDRYGIPLAINKVHYNVSVSYGGIREVPRTVWKTTEEGKKVKVFKRKEYIESLAKMLSEELSLDKERLEDLIHSKASVFGNVPFVIKEEISEEIYFRLKMREKDFPGLVAERASRRYYPQGAVGSEVIGYLGAISKSEYDKIAAEMHLLQNYLTALEEGQEIELPRGYVNADTVARRLKELESKAYSINDKVGKMGVERTYDEKLRGHFGAKLFLADTRGNFLQELEGGREKKPGNHLTLTLSVALQEYAERLLGEYENTKQAAASYPAKFPWIKGGAIVAMNPQNGEVYALASYPRFNPNDFIEKNEKIPQWLENENFLSDIWNQKRALFREKFDSKKGVFIAEEVTITWSEYLQMILPATSTVLKRAQMLTVKEALFIQKATLNLLQTFHFDGAASKVFDAVWGEDPLVGVKPTLPEKDVLEETLQKSPEAIASLKTALQPYFSHLRNDEKLLLADLCRLSVQADNFSPFMGELMGEQTVEEYRQAAVCFGSVKESLEDCVKELFHSLDFKKWREAFSKEFLAGKRKEEMRKRRSGRPYIEYLDEKEAELFSAFWQKQSHDFLALLFTKKTNNPLLEPYVESLFQKTCALQEQESFLRLQRIVNELDDSILIPYLQTFESTNTQAPLLGSYGITKAESSSLKDLARAFYPRYGYGFTRSQAFQREATIGSVFKLIPAYEALKQKYHHLVQQGRGLNDLNPLVIVDDKKKVGKEWLVGYTQDNKPLQRYWKGGVLPRSDHVGIGKVDLVSALAASSNPYFALLAGDVLSDPEDLCKAAALFSFGGKTGIDLPGEIKGNIPKDVTYNRTGLYSFAIGQHSLFGTPLQIAVMLSTIANGGKVVQPKMVLKEADQFLPTVVKREIFLPSPIRDLLLKGMKQVIFSEKGTARSLRQHFPETLISQIVGKTSTAEVVEKVSLDGANGKAMCKHVSFGLIHFENGDYSKPALVVVVYLRFGTYGNIAAPYAVKMIQKWQEIQGTH